MQSKLANTAVWTLTALVAGLFLLSGVPKFFDPGWVSRFAGWGYAEWFVYVIAALESAGAIGLLLPRLAPFAAVGLVGIMIGAIWTHVTHDQGFVWNLAYITCLAIIGAYRWRHRAPDAAAQSS